MTLKYVRIAKRAMDYMKAGYLLDILKEHGIVQIVDNKMAIVVGRYSTNKAKLRKVMSE